MNFSKDRIITRKLSEIHALIHEDELLLPQWETKCGTYLGDSRYKDVEPNYSAISVGERWICCDDFTRWFRATVTVPKEFEGKLLALNLEFGGEGIVRVNGEIKSAITSYLVPNEATRTRVMLSDCAKAGETYLVEIEAHTNYMEFAHFRAQGDTSIEYIIRTANLVTINDAVEAYYFDLKTAFDAMQTLRNPVEKIVKSPVRLPDDVLGLFESFSKDTYFYDKVTDAVVSSLSCVDFDFDREDIINSIPQASQVLKKKLGEINHQSHAVIKFVGQAHIDTAWLWPVRESIRKSAKTLSNVCSLMDKYPEFTFAFSQPQLFEFAKNNYPELYERVKEKVKTGQFELVGNTWVEMDTNIPSGESLVRQILYGRQYFIQEFGKCSDVFWMPDVFGYSWALPQIIKRSGMKYFFTSKLINNDDNRFPYSLFNWQGVDGTKITAYLQRLNYNGMVSAKTLDTLYGRFDQKGIIDESLMTFGFGDGGGGPTYQMLETARRLEDFPGLPKLEMATSESFFKNTDEVQDKLPTWNDEMYYEFHRGTYSSQSNTKKGNRKSEFLYRQSEIANVFAYQDFDKAYPYDKLLKGYKKLLTNQFHDIMPGSSINSVYVDAKKDYEEIKAIGTSTMNIAVGEIVSNIAHDLSTVVVFNFLSWNRTEKTIVDLTGTKFENELKLSVRDNDGKVVSGAISEVNGIKYLEFVAVNVPAMGYKAFEIIIENISDKGKDICISKKCMENKFYKITLDDNANVTSIFDKINSREVLTEKSNLLKIFEDKPSCESAWNIDIEYQNKEWHVKDTSSIDVICQNSVKGVLRIKRTFHKSAFTQDIVIYADSNRIDFINYVDWYETEKMLKAEFNVDVLSSKATYEIQFGAIERPTHYNTSYDKTKFEVSAHKWADLSEGNYGVSLLNDCKYGYDIKDSRMRITLLRSPVDPDPVADKGYHEFTYSIVPHKGNWISADIVNRGYELNAPLHAVLCSDVNTTGMLPYEKSYISCNCNNVVVDTVKCAEDKDGIIVRVYEATGSKTVASLSFGFDINTVIECNLVEQEEQSVQTVENALTFEIKPFEIKSFKIKKQKTKGRVDTI